MQEQNALIGVQMAALFPDISLSALLQWSGKPALSLQCGRTRFGHWAARPRRSCLTADCAGADRRRACGLLAKRRHLSANRASAFQGVEDELAAIRILDATAGRATEGCQLSAGGVRIYLNQFQGGTAPFTTVVTAQIQLLSYEESELTIRQKFVSGERPPDPGSRWRLGRQSVADQERTRKPISHYCHNCRQTGQAFGSSHLKLLQSR